MNDRVAVVTGGGSGIGGAAAVGAAGGGGGDGSDLDVGRVDVGILSVPWLSNNNIVSGDGNQGSRAHSELVQLTHGFPELVRWSYDFNDRAGSEQRYRPTPGQGPSECQSNGIQHHRP